MGRISSVSCLFMVIFLVGCKPPLNEPLPNITPPKMVMDVLELVLESDKMTYSPGEKVVVKLTVTNKGDEPFLHTFRSSQMYDFIVKKDDEEIWRWSNDKMFLTVLTEFSLNPGQSVSYEDVWDQRGNDGKPVPPGRYELIGVLKTVPESLSFPLTIEITAN